MKMSYLNFGSWNLNQIFLLWGQLMRIYPLSRYAKKIHSTLSLLFLSLSPFALFLYLFSLFLTNEWKIEEKFPRTRKEQGERFLTQWEVLKVIDVNFSTMTMDIISFLQSFHSYYHFILTIISVFELNGNKKLNKVTKLKKNHTLFTKRHSFNRLINLVSLLFSFIPLSLLLFSFNSPVHYFFILSLSWIFFFHFYTFLSFIHSFFSHSPFSSSLSLFRFPAWNVPIWRVFWLAFHLIMKDWNQN